MNTAQYLALIFAILCSNCTQCNDDWNGRWFPDSQVSLADAQHGIKMGIINSDCDDGIKDISNDYDGNQGYYLCYYKHFDFPDRRLLNPLLYVSNIPVFYHAPHYCLNTTISYNDIIPTFGGHRPLWPRYGEYTYVPRERYLHSLEHGAIVLLYHPCANREEVIMLKNIVKTCLKKYIISANPDLDRERPFALLAWGYLLRMPIADSEVATSFIRKYAYKGPEVTSNDGQYDFGLIESSNIHPESEALLC